MTPKPDVAMLVRELRATLDQIGDALVDGRYDDLITTESRLAGVVSGFAVAYTNGAFTESAIPQPPIAELHETLNSLRRCQRLGTNLDELSTAWIAAGHAAATGYDRSGHGSGQPYGQSPTPTLQTRA